MASVSHRQHASGGLQKFEQEITGTTENCCLCSPLSPLFLALIETLLGYLDFYSMTSYQRRGAGVQEQVCHVWYWGNRNSETTKNTKDTKS